MPQFIESVIRSTHLPSQSVVRGGQLPRQRPREQTSPMAQVIPQLPQFTGSLSTVIQRPLHSSCPPAQAQAPFTQVVPAGQTIPQVPQFMGSVSRCTQVVPHRSCPAGQGASGPGPRSMGVPTSRIPASGVPPLPPRGGRP